MSKSQSSSTVGRSIPCSQYRCKHRARFYWIDVLDDSAEQYDATRYAFKPSLVGVPSEFILDDAAIEWRSGARTVRVLYRDIKQIRLCCIARSACRAIGFVAEVKSRTGIKFTIASTSWHSLVEHQSHGPQYKAFIAELHRRVAATGSPVNYIAGSPAFFTGWDLWFFPA